MKAVTLAAIAALLAGSAVAGAAEYATKDEAMAVVKKASAMIKAEGPDKAYAEIDNKKGRFTDRDLYVVVYSLSGKVLAHGANEKMIGKEMFETTDVDGKYYIKERIELARSKGTFWQNYKFVNPTNKKIMPKEMYCEKLDETAVCAGVYKF